MSGVGTLCANIMVGTLCERNIMSEHYGRNIMWAGSELNFYSKGEMFDVSAPTGNFHWWRIQHFQR